MARRGMDRRNRVSREGGGVAVCVATTLFGIAIAAAAAPALQRPSSARDLPAGIVAARLSPSGPTLQFALFVVSAFLFAWIGTRVARVPMPRWAIVAYCAATASAPVTLMHFGALRHVVLHGFVAAAIVAARRLNPRFSRHDAVLLPALLSCYFAFIDTDFGHTPAATFLRAAIAIFALRVIIGVVSRAAKPGLAFCAAPLALIAQTQLLAPKTSGILAIAWLFASPFLLMRISELRLKRFAAFVAYPLIAALYPLAILGLASPPPVDFYEDVHDLLPAAEVMRGETLYRDIVPIHGLVSDGGLALVAMKAGASSLAPILRMRFVVSMLNLVAIYFVAFAAIGSADFALLAVFLAIALLPSETFWIRTIVSLFTLAAVIAGTRLRSRKWFAIAGALASLAFLVSLDFAIYAAVVAFIAASRARQLRVFAIGAAISAAASLLLLAICGFAGDLVRVTISEIFGRRGVYMMGALSVPECMTSLSAMAANIGSPECLGILLWILALLGAAAAFARRPLRSLRSDAVWYAALWIVIAALSYVERRHFYYLFCGGAFLAAALYHLGRRSRPAAIALTIAVVFLARPFAHVFDLATPLRRSHGMSLPATLQSPPRARGAAFDPRTAQAIPVAERFVSTLGPRETFFDFANAGLLYYLFDRDCPVRQMHVPMYETEDAQREVIAALERNRNVTAALMVFPSAYSAIDGVPNDDRAPLVRRYLETHFAPAFDEDGVVFWRRR